MCGSFLEQKPPPQQRNGFNEDYFSKLVLAWSQLPREGQALLVEDYPWAYLLKHSTLASLQLPNLTLIFHASGRAIGLRHPLHNFNPDQHSQVACE